MTNSDPRELDKFSQMAHRWWDPSGSFKPLHDLNPARLSYIDQRVGLSGKSVLDVGCGGGLLSEGMASHGAQVTGIDLAEKPLQIARLHLMESGLSVDYQLIAVEEMASSRPGQFSVVTCLEMLEHVPDPACIVQACAAAVAPGGHVFFSTINRNPKAYFLAVLGAEYLLNILPRGTHEYAKFIQPAELAHWCRLAGLTVREVTGMHYNPFSSEVSLSNDTNVNFLMYATRDA